jgi:pimeloyl-ACP methyl ester carboxylesterase
MADPAVVLVHGFGSSFDHGWREPGWADLLADGGRAVIPVDLLGHGNADKPHDPSAYERLEDGVAAALPAEAVDAVGFSLGAHTLLRLAMESPERFRRLVIIGVGDNLFRNDDPGAAEAIARAVEGKADAEDLRARVFAEMATAPRNDPAALAACMRRRHRPLTAGDLAAATVPTLLVVGERDELAGNPRALAEALPDAKLVSLPKLDHFQTPRDFGCIDAALNFLGVTF